MLDMVANFCIPDIPDTQDPETEGPQTWGQPGLYRKVLSLKQR